MLRSLDSAVSGLEQFQTSLDVIGNNIANSNTFGFKAGRADFADSFSETLEAASGGTTSQTAGVQVGTGVGISTVKTNFTQGSVDQTGVGTDLMINGDGYFVASDAATGEQFATRAGDFQTDSSGYLVTSAGLRIQGFSDSSLTTRGDILIDGTGRPSTSSATATVVGFNIDSSGAVNVKLSERTQFVRGQVLLQTFQDPQMLTKEGNNLYSGLANAGPLGGTTPAAQAAGTNGLGSIQAGALELSNVDLASEFANLITTQRGFQANARVITTSDEVLQELVALKR